MPNSEASKTTSVEVLFGEVAEMKSAMKDVAAALTKLAVMEERYTTFAGIVGKVLERLEKVEDRQRKFEVHSELFERLLTRFEMMDARTQTLERNQVVLTTSLETAGKTSALWAKILWAVCGGGVISALAFVIKGVSQ